MPNEQYDEICKEEFAKLHRKLDKIDNKLFIDNGDKCVQSRVNSNSQLLKIVIGVFSVIGGAVVSVLAWVLKANLSG